MVMDISFCEVDMTDFEPQLDLSVLKMSLAT
jgi:hypothetical protein